MLPYLVAQAGEGNGDALALQLADEVDKCVARADINLVHGPGVHEHWLRRRAARGQAGRQPVAQVTDVGEEQVATGAPDQKPGEGDRVGVSFHVR
jgi:hypothetical protein